MLRKGHCFHHVQRISVNFNLLDDADVASYTDNNTNCSTTENIEELILLSDIICQTFFYFLSENVKLFVDLICIVSLRTISYVLQPR